MSRIIWDATGERFYKNGINRGVLYLIGSNGTYNTGQAWNGLISVNENPSGGEPTAFYADNAKYVNLVSAEEFAASIEAYACPDAFRDCVGTNELIPGLSIGGQKKKKFGLCYRVELGSDMFGHSQDYEIHIVFKCLAMPSSAEYRTTNDTPDLLTLSWDVEAEKILYGTNKPTATVVLNSRMFRKSESLNVLKDIEDVLYGTEENASTIPSFDEIVTIVDRGIHLLDSSNDFILDSSGDPIRTRIF